MSNSPKYPEIHVPLVGQDSNAFSILGRVRAAMRRAGVSAEDQSAFHAEATSGDYDHLLRTVTKWVSAEEEDEDDWDDYSVYDEEDY